MSRKVGLHEPRRVPFQERAKARVEVILESTLELLREQGVGAVTTARIAERAGVPVGSVYQYFPNKKAIFAALFQASLDATRAEVERFEQSGPYEAGREAFLLEFVAVMRKAVAVGSGLDAVRVAYHAYPELQELEARQVKALVETMVRILRRLGSRWPRPKLRRLMHYLFCLIEGGARYRRQYQPPGAEVGAWLTSLMLQTFELCFED